MRGKIRLAVFLFLILLLTFSSCQNPLVEAFGYHKVVGTDLIEGAGTVTFLSFEGGFYGIATGRDGHWDPINLPAEFMKDGLRVKFRAKLRNDLVSFHMWGVLVELLSIDKT